MWHRRQRREGAPWLPPPLLLLPTTDAVSEEEAPSPPSQRLHAVQEDLLAEGISLHRSRLEVRVAVQHERLSHATAAPQPIASHAPIDIPVDADAAIRVIPVNPSANPVAATHGDTFMRPRRISIGDIVTAVEHAIPMSRSREAAGDWGRLSMSGASEHSAPGDVSAADVDEKALHAVSGRGARGHRPVRRPLTAWMQTYLVAASAVNPVTLKFTTAVVEARCVCVLGAL